MTMLLVVVCLYIQICVADRISCAIQDYDTSPNNEYYVYVYSGGEQQVVSVELYT